MTRHEINGRKSKKTNHTKTANRNDNLCSREGQRICLIYFMALRKGGDRMREGNFLSASIQSIVM
jgi:hypothetical protein